MRKQICEHINTWKLYYEVKFKKQKRKKNNTLFVLYI